MRKKSRMLAAALAAALLVSAGTQVLAAPADRTEPPASLKDVYENHFLVGNVYNNDSEYDPGTTLGAMRVSNFNAITAENNMKPSSLSRGNTGNAPTYTFGAADAMMETAMRNDMAVHGHVFVWHSQSPTWLNGGGGGLPGPIDRATAKENMESYIKTVAEHFDTEYPGVIISWDVVNEAFVDSVSSIREGDYWRDYLRGANQSGWIRAYSTGMDAEAGEDPSDFIYDAFVFARRYTDAELVYNDFNMYEDGKSKLVAQMVTELNAQYAAEYPEDSRLLIERVGMQSHNYMMDTPASSVERGIQNLIASGAQISISELDLFCFFPWNAEPSGGYVDLGKRTAEQLVGSTGTAEQRNYWANRGITTGAEAELAQAERYAEYFLVYMKYAEYIDRVTFWGLRDNNSWRSGHNPLLVNSDNTYKEAFYAVADPVGYLAKAEESALVLTSDRRIVSKGEYFNVSASMVPAAESNAATISFSYNPEKFSFNSFEAADGVTVLETRRDDNAGTVAITVGNLGSYELAEVGSLKLYARHDVEFVNERLPIDAGIDYVTYSGGQKVIVSSADSVLVGTRGMEGDTDGDGKITLIDLSNMIDWFGVNAGDPEWDEAEFFDFNENGTIDISDISRVASLIE